jgi:hypothetical protein
MGQKSSVMLEASGVATTGRDVCEHVIEHQKQLEDAKILLFDLLHLGSFLEASSWSSCDSFSPSDNN